MEISVYAGYNRKRTLFYGRKYIMALIECPKYGKIISDKAQKCVECGWVLDMSV